MLAVKTECSGACPRVCTVGQMDALVRERAWNKEVGVVDPPY
jgi:hypothetical protein